MTNYYILHFLHHSGECAIHNHKVFTTERLESPLPPSPPLKSFPTSIESYGVFDPIVHEQTQVQHYFSPIPTCGLQTLGDQSDVQRAIIHIILCPANAPTLKKVAIFFSHRTISHLSFSWPMHALALLYVLPWNPHALMSIQLSFLLSNNQVQR
jgi:hypothetical protein